MTVFAGIPPRYVTKPTRSTQLCIPLESQNQVPGLTGWGKSGNVKVKRKVTKRIAVCATSTALPQELTCRMRSPSVTCHPAEVIFLPLPQPIRLILDLATP